MIRKYLSIFVGIVSGVIVLFLIELIGHLIFRPPNNIDYTDIEALKQHTKNAPVFIFIMLIIAYSIGSFIGGFIAGLLSKEKKTDNAVTVGGILLGFGTYSLFSLPHPTWVIICSLLVFIPFSWIGGKTAERKKSKKEMSEN